MGQITNYSEWIKRTNYDWRHPRSSDLKKLDEKVEYYFVNWKSNRYKQATDECLKEFYSYCQKKCQENKDYLPVPGTMARLSNKFPRNRDGAFDDLFQTLQTNTYVIDPRMRAAQQAMLAGQLSQLQRLLTGPGGEPREFTMKNTSLLEDFKAKVKEVANTVRSGANTIAPNTFSGRTFNPGTVNKPGQVGNKPGFVNTTDVRNMGSNMNDLRSGINDMRDAVHGVTQTPAQLGAEVTNQLAGIVSRETADKVGHAVAEVAPIVGHIISGVQLVSAIVDSARAHYAQYSMEKMSKMGYVQPGSPQMALDAVITLYGRILVEKDIDLGMATAKFGAQFDPTRIASAAVGISDAARKIVQLTLKLIRDYDEVLAGNDFLAKKQFRRGFEEMFLECPLLGAYVLVGSDTSSVINVAVQFYGTTGWDVQVEQLKAKLDDAIAVAMDLIKASKFELAGFPKVPSNTTKVQEVSKGLRAEMLSSGRITGFGSNG